MHTRSELSRLTVDAAAVPPNRHPIRHGSMFEGQLQPAAFSRPQVACASHANRSNGHGTTQDAPDLCRPAVVSRYAARECNTKLGG